MIGLARHWWRTAKKSWNTSRALRLPAGGKLHVGCGPVHLDGWINIDNRRYDAADYEVDVRDGLPFRNLRFIFAEHFVEHLPYFEIERFFRDCRNALAPEGVFRLSTPNLDWVVATQYNGGDSIRDCFALNTSFRGWGHQFLFNAPTLAASLQRAGFARVEFRSYGDSAHAWARAPRDVAGQRRTASRSRRRGQRCRRRVESGARQRRERLPADAWSIVRRPR